MPKSPFIKDPNAAPAPLPSRDALLAEAKRRGMEIEVVAPEEKARREGVIRYSAQDCIWWITNFTYTHDPRDLSSPYVRFKLFDRQKELIHWLQDRLVKKEPGCIEKSRDTGVSWVFCAFMLWLWMFKPGFAGGLGSRKLEYVDQKGDPKTLFEKFRIIMDNLPSWLIPPGFDKKKHDLEAKLVNPWTRGTIIGEGGDNIGQGGRTTMFGVDEYNLLEHPELADGGLSDNTHCPIYIGTPNGLVGIYTKRTIWPLFTLHWVDDPRKNHWAERNKHRQIVSEGDGRHPSGGVPKFDTYPSVSSEGHTVHYAWYEEYREKFRDQPWIVKAMADIDYLGSGYPRFDRPYLVSLLETAKLIPPLLTEVPGSTAWAGEVLTYQWPDNQGRYLIVADVAEGESKNTNGDPDWSVAHVYDCETWEQVGSYRGRCDTHAYAVDLAAWGEMYNFAEICVERTGPGLSTIKALTEEIGYPSIWGEYGAGGTIKHGWMATAKSKVEAENELASIIADMKLGFEGFVWNDSRTLEELIHYAVLPNGRAEAEKGWHDDHVSACRMAALLLPRMTTRRKMLPTTPPPPSVPYAVGGRGRR